MTGTDLFFCFPKLNRQIKSKAQALNKQEEKVMDRLYFRSDFVSVSELKLLVKLHRVRACFVLSSPAATKDESIDFKVSAEEF